MNARWRVGADWAAGAVGAVGDLDVLKALGELLQSHRRASARARCSISSFISLSAQRGPRTPTTWPSRMRTRDRKSTRLNSSHITISYAVFCLKKNTISHLL